MTRKLRIQLAEVTLLSYIVFLFKFLNFLNYNLVDGFSSI